MQCSATEYHSLPLDGTHCNYPRMDGQAEMTWMAGYTVCTGHTMRSIT